MSEPFRHPAPTSPARRRTLRPRAVLGLLILPWALAAGPTIAAPPAADAETAAPAAPRQERVAVELTFLKALPGERERLVRFIELNWFEMDRIAVEQGLMREYRVLDTGEDEGDWNVLVEVVYRDERGYAGIVEAFERIRAAHPTVLVDGKSLPALGKIVSSRRTYLSLPARPTE